MAATARSSASRGQRELKFTDRPVRCSQRPRQGSQDDCAVAATDQTAPAARAGRTERAAAGTSVPTRQRAGLDVCPRREDSPGQDQLSSRESVATVTGHQASVRSRPSRNTLQPTGKVARSQPFASWLGLGGAGEPSSDDASGICRRSGSGKRVQNERKPSDAERALDAPSVDMAMLASTVHIRRTPNSRLSFTQTL